MVSAGYALKRLADEHNLCVLVSSWRQILTRAAVQTLLGIFIQNLHYFLRSKPIIAHLTASSNYLLVEKTCKYFISNLVSAAVLENAIETDCVLRVASNKVTNHMVGGEGGLPKPALGESWKSIPHVRLLLSREHGSSISTVSVLKHTSMVGLLLGPSLNCHFKQNQSRGTEIIHMM